MEDTQGLEETDAQERWTISTCMHIHANVCIQYVWIKRNRVKPSRNERYPGRERERDPNLMQSEAGV